jgi:hypothetical protein
VKISCDFIVLSNAVTNKSKLTVVRSADDGRLVVICLILRTSKLRLISPYISFTGVYVGGAVSQLLQVSEISGEM